MLRTVNPEKGKQLKPKVKTAVFIALWIVLFGAAMLFIAFAAHL
jgi:hypothetical protein